jgi:ankyrin repeat protein
MALRTLAIAWLAATCLPAVAVAAEGGGTALFDAAKRGDRIAVSKLLDQGADVHARAVDETTALHWAVRADSLDTATLLLESGADARAADRYGVTPLYLAAENGDAAMIAKLLDAGADANAVAPIGETALMTATRTGIPTALTLLLDRGATVDARDPEFQQTALMLAVRESHPEAVQLLLARGAEPNARTRVGPDPKFVPPCKGTGCGSEGVGINRGGLPNRGRRGSAAGGMTPLLYAARDGRVEEARLLVAAGAIVEIGEANGIRPLLMALLNNQLPIARLLIEHGADVNADDFWGRAPLFAAVDYRNLDMNNRDEDSPTTNYVDRAPLLDMLALLLEHGADVDAQRANYRQAAAGCIPGDVSWVDFTGQTPFLRARCPGDGRDAATARARRRSESGDAGRHHAADGRGRRELGGGANLHRVEAVAAGCYRPLHRARRRSQRDELDGLDPAARRRQSRLERDYPQARGARRASRRRRQGRPRRAALGRGRIPRGGGRRAQARDDRAAARAHGTATLSAATR